MNSDFGFFTFRNDPMDIKDLQALYAKNPKVKALGHLLCDSKERHIVLDGLVASSAPMMFGALPLCEPKAFGRPYIFVMDDEEQAGYFYNDLNQILGQ